MKTIIITGGGTAGHVTPALALVDTLQKNGYNIHYIGGNGIEKEIVTKYKNITYHEISCEKLRRSLSLKNLLIPFKVIKGICQTKTIIKEIKPNVIFSKGGFVALPVVIAGHQKHIPIIGHESDMSMGLANKIIYKYCDKMCFSFEKTAQDYTKKGIYTSSPIRKEIFMGNKNKIIDKYHLQDRPTILIFGGSLGARAINEAVRNSLNDLSKYNILHIVGKNNIDKKYDNFCNYHQIDFTNNIQDYFAASDIVICRAGSNSINELLYINKPMILIPLPKGNSRGDQIDNAKYFEKMGYAKVLYQENLSPKTLKENIEEMYKYKQKYVEKMKNAPKPDAVKEICNIIQNHSL